MEKRRRNQEEQARINETDVYGITLLDIKKKDSDNRVFLCLVRAILLFLAVYGTIVGLAAAFELPFSVPIVSITLLVLCIFSSFIYFNRVTFYVGYVMVFLLLIIMAFAFYMYINSGFTAFLNEVISKYETFFGLVSGRVANEQIADRYMSVSAMLIFVGGVFSIFFNITISGYMDLPMTFIVSFLPLQFAFYIDIVPPLIYLIMLLSVYISVAVLGRSGRYTLPYRYKKDIPFGRRRTKDKQIHYYHASGRGMLQMMGYSLLLSIIVMIVVGGVFESDFSTKKLSNAVKDVTDKYVKTAVVSGVTSLFNRYDAVGGLSKGQLGGIRSVNPDYQTDLIVDYVMSSKDDIYLKAYTGVRYEKNRFYNTFNGKSALTTADDIIMSDDYMPNNSNEANYTKMRIENVDADKTYDYQPYIPVYTTTEEKPSVTGVATARTDYISSIIDTLGITITPSLPNNTYETIYIPLIANNNLGADEPSRLELYQSLYLSYPSSLNDTLASVCNEANLTSEEIANKIPRVRTIMIAENLKKFYESSFTYTYTPGATPYNEDMVQYFLTKNRKGFCAHFAASATLILRYMGIPARYCEGYLLQPSVITNNTKLSDDTTGWVSQNNNMSVEGLYQIELSDANAHSWVEIYVDGYGWIPYEMTPPAPDVEESSSNLGFLSLFAGLFNPTERLIDDTDGSVTKGLKSSANQLSDALSDASESSGQNGFIKFARSIGYLLIPFISMIIALIFIILIWIIVKYMIFEIQRRSFLRQEKYGDALLLEYKNILKKLRRKKIITSKNPSVREVEEILSNEIKNSDKSLGRITDEELSELINAIYISGFSKDEITKDVYQRARDLIRKI